MTSRSGARRGDPVRPAWLRASENAIAGVFARSGFTGTRMHDLVLASGVPRATLYYHFQGKDAVLGWLMDLTVGHVSVAVRAAADRPGTGRDRLEAVMRAVLTTMAAHPDACRVLIGNLEQAAQLNETVEGLVAAFHAPVVALLSDGVADRSLRAVRDPMSTASAIFGAVTIPALQALVVDGELALGAVGDAITELVLDGLRVRP